MRSAPKKKSKNADGNPAEAGSALERIKRSARLLFAERGFDGVSVRDIVAHAGAKNGGSLHYYFGSKEGLVRELIADGAKIIDERRAAQVDRWEREGYSPAIRDIASLILHSATNLSPPGEIDTYGRFITMLQINHRDLFLAAVGDEWNVGYRRCVALLQERLGIDSDMVRHRLVTFIIFANALLASREAAIASGGTGFWSQPETFERCIDSAEALLMAGEDRGEA